MRLIVNSAKLSSTNNLSFYLPNEVSNIKSFKLISCSIPFSFYNVTSTNNQILINSTSYFIPVQNYNMYQLSTAINTAILASGVTITINYQTLKYTFTAGTSFTFNALNMGVLLGFQSQFAYNSVANALTSVNMADLTNGIRSL